MYSIRTPFVRLAIVAALAAGAIAGGAMATDASDGDVTARKAGDQQFALNFSMRGV